MPQAVTHILFPLILMALFRNFYLSKNKKRSFPLYYVFIAGLGGIISDLDIAVFYLLYFFGFTFSEVHKTYTHSLIFPLILFILSISLRPLKKNFTRHKLKLNIIFLMLSLGVLSHIFLDNLLGKPFAIFYPLSNLTFSLDLVSYLPLALQSSAIACLDAALLIIWLLYLEIKHKLSDVI